MFLFAFILIQAYAFCAYSGPQIPNIEIDVSKKVGMLKSLRGVNGAPKRPAMQRRGVNYPAEDSTEGYREARIDLIRTHGSSVWELATLFPDSSADPSLPESYNFGPSDEVIKSIHDLGAEPLFKIGHKADLPLILSDMAKYGEIIRHVVLHYNQGWAKGFQYNIKYWEVWNEPDLAKIHWEGTPEQFYRVYEAAAKGVKSVDPDALIGGAALAMVNEPTPYREGFLAFVRDNHIPLDFFSWHYYSVDADDPYDFVRIGSSMQELLNQYGFKNTLNILDEWNCDFREVQTIDQMSLASFQASALIYMQESEIDHAAMWYSSSPLGVKNSPAKAGQGMIAVGRMARTPEKLQVTGLNTNDGLAAQAGRSEDGSIIQILISNYQIPEKYMGPRKGEDVLHEGDLFDLKLLPRRTVTYDANGGYNLVINGLNPKADYDIERYRITKERDFSLLDKSRAKGAKVRLQAELPPPAIELIVITKAYDYPDKQLWYDTTIYGGNASAAKIVAGNGSKGFDIEKFINSEMGEKIMSMVKNELVIYGGKNWNHPDMMKYWTDRGVIKEIHNIEDTKHTWISYLPDYMKKKGNTQKYPVVFSAHGGGGTLFEAENHGFVTICHEKGFIVVAPENENSNAKVSAANLKSTLDEMEKLGYPIDRSRVYYTGMSAGGSASLYTGLKDYKLVAAIAAHSSPRPLDKTSDRYPQLITDDMYNIGTEVPMWLAVGEYDYAQLPLSEGTIAGLNSWLTMNGCSKTSATKDNMIGITADSVTVKKLYGVNYIFADFYNKQGVKMNQIIGIQGHPHWVNPSFAGFAWDFMSKFSRSENGKLIVNRK